MCNNRNEARSLGGRCCASSSMGPVHSDFLGIVAKKSVNSHTRKFASQDSATQGKFSPICLNLRNIGIPGN